MHIYWHGNDSEDIQVRLTYSNAALLEQMNIHYVEENPPPIEPVKHEELSEDDKRRRVSPYGTIKLDDEGASDALRGADQPAGGGVEGAALAVGAGQASSRQVAGAGQGLCRAAPLHALQSDDRPHQRVRRSSRP